MNNSTGRNFHRRVTGGLDVWVFFLSVYFFVFTFGLMSMLGILRAHLVVIEEQNETALTRPAISARVRVVADNTDTVNDKLDMLLTHLVKQGELGLPGFADQNKRSTEYVGFHKR